MIYLDYSANTPADEKVIESFVNTEKSFTANPNSNYISGKKAAEKMAETIEKSKTFKYCSLADNLHFGCERIQ